MAKKVVCSVCGYVFEDPDNLPDVCPQCKAPKSKFIVKDDAPAASWADEHKIGVAAGLDAEVVEGCAQTSPANARKLECTLQ